MKLLLLLCILFVYANPLPINTPDITDDVVDATGKPAKRIFGNVLGSLTGNNKREEKKESDKDNNPLGGIGNVIGSLTGNNQNQEQNNSGPLSGIGNAIGSLTGNNENKEPDNKNPLLSLIPGMPLVGNSGSGSPLSKIQLYFGGNAGILLPLDAIPSSILRVLSTIMKLGQTTGNVGNLAENLLNPVKGIGNALKVNN